jgi:nickel-type superoxide dismutase maturation protease
MRGNDMGMQRSMADRRSLPSWWRRVTSERVEVHEGSMRPILVPGDRLLVDTQAYRGRRPANGEIVLLDDPESPGRSLVKRVAAAPTGTPDGMLWVLGDAEIGSRDSRQFGPVPAEMVRGRVYFRYAPRSREGFLPEPGGSPGPTRSAASDGQGADQGAREGTAPGA